MEVTEMTDCGRRLRQTAGQHQEYAPGQDPGRCDIFSIKEYRRKEFQLVSVDTLLNWTDIWNDSTHV